MSFDIASALGRFQRERTERGSGARSKRAHRRERSRSQLEANPGQGYLASRHHQAAKSRKNELETVTVRVFLEKVTPLLGLLVSDAPSLQAEFSETILAHQLEMEGAGLCDESLCNA